MKPNKTTLNDCLRFTALGLVLMSCGPVNQAPSADSAAASAKKSAQAGAASAKSSLSYSDNQLFVVIIEQLPPSPSPAPTASPVATSAGVAPDPASDIAIGKNQYVVHLVRGNDLSPVSNQAKITVDYTHMHAKIPRSYHSLAERQADGSFLVTVYFQKPGTWNLTFHLSDSETTPDVNLQDDDYSLSVSL